MNDNDRESGPDSKTLFWNRVQLIAIAVVFLAPIAGAFLYKPTKFNNYGDLYTPARPLAPLALKAVSEAGGEVANFSEFQDQSLWAFLVVVQGECGEKCERSILNSRQLRAMQGKHLERLRNVLIYSDLSDQAAQDLAAKYQPIQVYRASTSELATWSQQLALEELTPEQAKDRFYVVDSRGLLMISYPSDAEPKRVNQDLKRLLKARR